MIAHYIKDKTGWFGPYYDIIPKSRDDVYEVDVGKLASRTAYCPPEIGQVVRSVINMTGPNQDRENDRAYMLRC